MKRFVAFTLAALFGLGGVAFAQGIRVEEEKKKEETKVRVVKKEAPGGASIAVSGDWESMSPEMKKKLLEQMRKHMTDEQLKEALEKLVKTKGGGTAPVVTPKISGKLKVIVEEGGKPFDVEVEKDSRHGRVIIMKEGDKDEEIIIEGEIPEEIRKRVMERMHRGHATRPQARSFGPGPRRYRRQAQPARPSDGLREAIDALRHEITLLRHEIRGAHAARKPAATGRVMVARPPVKAAPKQGKVKAKGGFSFRGAPAAGVAFKAAPVKPNPEVVELRKQVADLKTEVTDMKKMMEMILHRLEEMQQEKKAAK